ncbi:MAG: CHAD domain-containing protein [Pseudomonadota bacterium]
MTYQFARGELFGEGIERVAHEEIDTAITHLTARSGDAGLHVHEARKSLKKLRALIRLVRGHDKRKFQTNNQAFRSLAHALSQWREADVAHKTAQAFCARSRNKANIHRWRLICRALRPNHNGVLSSCKEMRRQSLPIVSAFNSAKRHLSIGKSKKKTNDFELIRQGVRAVHRQMLRDFQATKDGLSPDASHEWRKSTKYHWYHIRLLERAMPRVLKPYRLKLEKLGEILGEEHDLADLMAFIGNLHLSELTTADRTAIYRDIKDRRLKLRTRSLDLGETIARESTNALLNRLETYLIDWHEDAAA